MWPLANHNTPNSIIMVNDSPLTLLPIRIIVCLVRIRVQLGSDPGPAWFASGCPWFGSRFQNPKRRRRRYIIYNIGEGDCHGQVHGAYNYIIYKDHINDDDDNNNTSMHVHEHATQHGASASVSWCLEFEVATHTHTHTHKRTCHV